MALSVTPVKSPRYLYECIDLNKRKIVVNASGDRASTLIPVICRMKESHANFLGALVALIDSDDPRRFGVRSVVRPDETTDDTDAKEQPENYVKRIGGFRSDTFTLIARGTIELTYTDIDDDGKTTAVKVSKKSIGIGMPAGVSLYRFVRWLDGLPDAKYNQLRGVRSPDGVLFEFGKKA